MFKFTILLAFLASVAAFSGMPSTARTASSKVSMSARDMVGSLPPVGFFDPLGLSNGVDPLDLRKYREAELKHGRVAMLATLGILVGEKFNPLFDGKITGAGIYHFQQADALLPTFWLIVSGFIGVVEGLNIVKGWETLPGRSLATLKDDYVNGDLGFDPLGFKPTDEAKFDTMRTKELQNGRLAMLGIAGIVAQELVTGQPLF